MSVQICLGKPDHNRFGKDILNSYYDCRAEKEIELFPEDPPEDVYANSEREWMLRELKSECDKKCPICEHLSTDILTLEMDELFSYGEDTIYGDDIRSFIGCLRTKIEEDDIGESEQQILITVIPLCEFALEHDLGVRLSV